MHAFADAYAHTKTDKRGKLYAYSKRFGHWKSSDPDIISLNSEKYIEYIRDLFSAINIHAKRTTELERLIKLIPRLSDNDGDAINQLLDIAKRYGFDIDKYNKFGAAESASITNNNIFDTLKWIDSNIHKP
jgi:hypothetical protein